jgi:glyoxylase-like metal-dependent hydrolase (beta-lactamase superfamily II)
MKTNSYHIETFSVGQLSTNCYLVFDTKTKDAVIIDPGDDGNYIAEKIVTFQLHPHAILITHGHFDHVLGVHELQNIFTIPAFINEKDNFLVKKMKNSAEYYLKRKIVEQEPIVTPILENTMSFGALVFDVLACPGHTPGGISYVLHNEDAIFTGDTVFAQGSVGRTDLSYSRPLDLARSICTLFQYPGRYRIYPGHGEHSTIGEEKALYDSKNNNR